MKKLLAALLISTTALTASADVIVIKKHEHLHCVTSVVDADVTTNCGHRKVIAMAINEVIENKVDGRNLNLTCATDLYQRSVNVDCYGHRLLSRVLTNKLNCKLNHECD